jgi:tetratricopeptide (TPR) repeat protein
LIWPFDLAVFYPHPRGDFSWLAVVAAALLLGTLCALAFRFRRACPSFFVGWFWFLGMLVPTLGIVQVGGQAMADRYAYLPGIGIVLALVFTLADALRTRPRLVAALSVALLCALGVQTRAQLHHWRDSEALFRQALAVTARNHIAHTQLAHALIQQGRQREAIPHLRSALQLDRNGLDALNNLAWALATDASSSPQTAREAQALARRAAELAPDDPGVLDTLAVAHARTGDFRSAIEIAKRGRLLAERSGDRQLLEVFETRLELFRARRTYSEAR